MEVYNNDDPFGVTSVAGAFLDVQPTEILVGVPRAVTIKHITGSQGIFVDAVALSGLSASDFRITNKVAGAFLVGKGEQRDILVEYSGSVDGAKAQLNVRFSNDNVLGIELVGKLPTVPPTASPETVAPTSDPTSEATQVVTFFLMTFPPVTESPSQAPIESPPAPLTIPEITPTRKCRRRGRKGRKRCGRRQQT